VRVAIDARLVSYAPGGITQYTLNLLRELVATAEDERYLVVQSRRERQRLATGPNVDVLRAWTPPHHRLEQVTLPVELARERIDVYHAPDFVAPRFGRFRTIVHHPRSGLPPHPGLLAPDSDRYYRQTQAAVREAARVIAVSESTRRDVQELLGVPDERIDPYP